MCPVITKLLLLFYIADALKHTCSIINYSWALRTTLHLCAVLKCKEFIGHTIFSYIKIYDEMMLMHSVVATPTPTHITTMWKPSGNCMISETQSGAANVFMCIASLVVAFTCTPDSVGTVDMEMHDTDFINMVLRESTYVTLGVTVEHIIYCRDQICKQRNYNFSTLRAPIRV